MRHACLSVVMVALFSLPIVPFLVFDDWLFPFITGKNFTFRILVEIAVVFWALLAVVDKNYRPRFSWLLPALASLAGIMLVANLLGEHPTKSFWSVFERMDGYVTLLHWVLLTVVLGSVLKDKRINFLGFKTTAWQVFFGAILIASILVVFKAMGQLAGTEVTTQGVRINSTLGNAAYMSIYMLFMLSIATLAIVKSKSLAWRVTYGILAGIFTTLLLLAATRGTVIGFFVGVILVALVIIFFERRAVKLRRFAVGSIVALCLLIGGLYLVKDTSLLVYRERNIAERLTSSISLSALDTRFTIWGMAMEGVEDRPILGWGQGNFDYVFSKHYEPSLYRVEPWYDRAHNILFDWLIAGGILGALAYFSILLVAFYYVAYRTLIKKDETFTVAEAGILIGLLAGYLIHNLVVFDNIISYLFFAVILAYIHSKVAKPIKSITEFKVDKSIAEYVVLPSGLLVLALIIYFVNVPGMTAAGGAIDVARSGTPTQVINVATKALAGGTFGNQEIRALVAQKAPNLLRDSKFSDEDKAALRDYVESEMLKQIEEKSGDAKIHSVLATFYLQTRQFDKAREQFALAREISPTKPTIIINQGITEYESGDHETAHSFFVEVYELVPEYDQARILYFATLILTERQDEATAMIDGLDEKGINSLISSRLVNQVLKFSDEYDILKQLLKSRVDAKPNDVDARVDLAEVYYDADDKEGAIGVLKEALADIPAFTEAGEKFIKNIEAGRSPRDDGETEESAAAKEALLKAVEEAEVETKIRN